MAFDVTVRLPVLLTWPVFLRRFEKLFIGENDEIALVAVDIPRRLFASLVYFVGTQGKCVVLVSSLSSH